MLRSKASRWAAAPYLVWMVIFIVVPLFIVIGYALTDAQGAFTLEADLPVATSLDYPIAFRSMTSGKGVYASEFIGYRDCPPGEGQETPRRGIDPLDHAKWILFARNAIQ